MSLAINISTAEGQILAAESRQSYRNQKGQARIGSDSASKVFKLSSRVGATTTGPAFLPEKDVLKNISKFIDDFRRNNDLDSLNVKQIAEKIHIFFDEKYPYKSQINNPPDLKLDLEKQGLKVIEVTPKDKFVEFKFKTPSGQIQTGRWAPDPLSLIVSGYDKDGAHSTYICYIPGDIQEKRNSNIKEKEYGASWTGQTDVITRIILGYDPRFMDALTMKGLVTSPNHGDQIAQAIKGLEYVISWGTMTLQDAIDLAGLMIQSTSAIQRFSDGIAINPGDIPGVGGPIDVAVITQEKGFVWINKKNLKVGDKELDLESIPNLQEHDSRMLDKPKPAKLKDSK